MGLIRKPHILKSNLKTTTPSEVLFVDTETEQVKQPNGDIEQRLKLGVACYSRFDTKLESYTYKWLHFTDKTDFWIWALKFVRDHQRLLILAHNLDFDFLVLDGVNALESKSYKARNLIISGNVNIWTFVKFKYTPGTARWRQHVKRHNKDPRVTQTLLFLDLMNYFKMSLAQLGESLNMPKLKIDFDTCTDKELLKYCRNDVAIMVEAWLTWIKYLRENNLGVWAKTLPGQAFNAYRHRFMPYEIYIHSNQYCLSLERSGYMGGRTECFQIGKFDKGPYYLFDINSLYPSVMHDFAYPTRMISYVKDGGLNSLLTEDPNIGIIARVKVVTSHPILPKRHETRLVFPTGTFWTTLTTPELELAREHAEILEVTRIAYYEMQPIFKSYIQFFWEQRVKYKAKGNKVYDMICKLLMNSLYGKFGQQLDDYQYLEDDPTRSIGYYKEYDADENKWVRFKAMNGKIELFTGRNESYNSFPAIAAHVTGYARRRLFKFLSKVPQSSLYYTDTDSLVVDRKGYDALKDGLSDTKLGALHLENQSDIIVINNVKDYVFAGRRKVKGVNTAGKPLNATQFKQWQQVSLKAIMWGAPNDKCMWKLVEKHLAQTYKKGDVDSNGLVTPLVFSESADPLGSDSL